MVKKMIRIAICDDDKYLGMNLEDIVLKYFERDFVKIEVDVYFSSEEFYRCIHEHTYNLIFLDIEMGTRSGIDIGTYIRKEQHNHKTEIIYISANEGYDRKLLELQPLHFLEKPLQGKQIIADLDLFMERFGLSEEQFIYRKGVDIYTISYADILYFESKGHEIRIVTTTSEDYYYDTMKNLLDIIQNETFLQIHKSYTVNYKHIKKFSYHCVELTNGTTLDIAQSKRKEIRKLQMNIMK